ncbi:MAG: hypothetical protein ACRDHL_07470, partial [Candidatus Promineifilaceae bacterium]
MNLLIIASIVVAATVAVGFAIARLALAFSNLVSNEQAGRERERSRYNVAVTEGHRIPLDGDVEDQLKTARQLAAKRAAATPRGANMRIGRFGGGQAYPTAFDGAEQDPVSAVRIAAFHGWQLFRAGGAAARPAQASVQATAGPAARSAGKSPEELVPGVDYPYTEVTEDMPGPEQRRLRIANAKARSAAVKALKRAGALAAGEAAAQPAADGAPAVAVSQPQAQPANGRRGAPAGEPVAGVDYEVIEITDAMSPDEVRRARISNSKARSAAMKAFK